jgi:hypothetical protein
MVLVPEYNSDDNDGGLADLRKWVEEEREVVDVQIQNSLIGIHFIPDSHANFCQFEGDVQNIKIE